MEAAAEAPSKKLPLREAVVRYQFPGWDDDPDLTAGELIQQFCEEALGFEADFRIEFDQEQHGFDVLELLDVWNDGRRETRLRGIFWVGEDRLSPIVEQDENDALAERINAAIGRLYSLLEGSLKISSKADRLKIWARQESLAKPLSGIPAYLFAKYTITDWFNGNAEANGGPRLFDIHLDLAPEEVTKHEGNSEKRATKLLAATLRERPKLSKGEGKTMLTDANITVSDRGSTTGFGQKRVRKLISPRKLRQGGSRQNHPA